MANAIISKLANVVAAKGKGQEAVFQAMKAVAYDVCENKDGMVQGCVISEQAYDVVKAHMTAHQFAGYVSALTKAGKYAARDDGFGRVFIGKKED